MKHFIRPLFLFSIVFFTIQNLQSQTISGKVTDANTGEELIGANLIFFDMANVIMTEAATDFDGNYSVTVGSPAARIEVTYVGYADKQVSIGGREKIDIALKEGFIFECTVSIGYKIPLINLASPTSGQIFSSDRVRNSAY